MSNRKRKSDKVSPKLLGGTGFSQIAEAFPKRRIAEKLKRKRSKTEDSFFRYSVTNEEDEQELTIIEPLTQTIDDTRTRSSIEIVEDEDDKATPRPKELSGGDFIISDSPPKSMQLSLQISDTPKSLEANEQSFTVKVLDIRTKSPHIEANCQILSEISVLSGRSKNSEITLWIHIDASERVRPGSVLEIISYK